MNTCNLRAYAKINLGLDVLGKREDGYHEVRMIMQTVNLYDSLFLKSIEKDDIIINCNKRYVPTGETNIVHKTAKLIREKYGLKRGLFVDLKKTIPVAAGMAGGSADAAATLVGMNKLFDLKLSREELTELAVGIGADVPYCVMRGTALAEGIGEKLCRLNPMPPCSILIAKPEISVSTKFVYSNLKIDENTIHPDIDGMIAAIGSGDYSGIISRMGNVLESVTIPAHPIIDEYKKKMVELGADGSLMSGSGPTVFGLFSDKGRADAACRKMRELYPKGSIYLSRPFNVGKSLTNKRALGDN